MTGVQTCALPISLGDLREKGTGHEIAQARFIARDDLKALGDIGLISRWVAEVLDPHAPPLQRVPRDEEDRLRFTGAWMALFTAPAKPGKTLCAHGGAKDL